MGKEGDMGLCQLGLMVELADWYVITSNRESGFGRYDVMLEPRKPDDDAMILEFKVQDKEREGAEVWVCFLWEKGVDWQCVW